MIYEDVVVLVAIEQELPRALVEPYDVFYTGVGKVNAAMAAMEVIRERAPKKIINFGTAGALTERLSGLVQVGVVFQRDMDVRAIGFALGQTPFEEAGEIMLQSEGVSCGTGDQFVSAVPELETDIVDMEAYAIAKVCVKAGVDFECWKYISDSADGSASGDWEENVAKGAELFAKVLIKK